MERFPLSQWGLIMAKNKFNRNGASYKRKHPASVSTGKTFLIVTEGKKTEPNYFNVLKSIFKLNIKIEPSPGTDPVSLVNKALELREKRKKESKKNVNIVAYDEVWVVFDLETPCSERHEQARQVKGESRSIGICWGISDPCFEYWFLLHEEYTTRLFGDCSEVISLLKNHWPDYEKGKTPSKEFVGKQNQAVNRAVKCREYHGASGSSGNPSTTIDKLICSLNAATRPYFRLVNIE
jgi:archaellin